MGGRQPRERTEALTEKLPEERTGDGLTFGIAAERQRQRAAREREEVRQAVRARLERRERPDAARPPVGPERDVRRAAGPSAAGVGNS
jgi:hypothetical protein